MGIIYSFNRKLLWTYYVPGTVLGMWDTAGNKTELRPAGADILGETGVLEGIECSQWTACGRAV